MLQALDYHEHRHRCEDLRTVVRRMEAAIFAYQLQSIDDFLLLTRWVHTRLSDCRCYFYEKPSTIQSISAQISVPSISLRWIQKDKPKLKSVTQGRDARQSTTLEV